MLILSRAHLSCEELIPITQPFIDFLSTAEDVSHSSWEYATKFLSEHILGIWRYANKNIIELTLSDKHNRNGDSSLSIYATLQMKSLILSFQTTYSFSRF